ncbi:MAG: Aspartate-semialdehyde dehydrogenase [Candidatus Omnitrophica bacterium ADurb.Bin277]|nr:MAG: Aspartate-semialdehyde dehydrogenase [Candidatus Omnitrophica bacterium ADurb.Bin277]
MKAGAVVVDNTSAFRMDPEVPLVIPEINPGDIAKHKGIIANPNCSTIIALVPLWPIHKVAKIKRIIAATYQAASGAGAKAMEELKLQTQDFLAGRPVKKEVLPHQIAFNVFSHNSKIGADGYNEEEVKMVKETKKIFHDDAIQITATCVRVPVLRAHSEALYVETEKPLSPDEARELLAKAPGVKVIDDREKNYFPMPLETTGQDDIWVGRLRVDPTVKNGLAMFVSGDQIRKGAATNAVQIAEILLKQQ